MGFQQFEKWEFVELIMNALTNDFSVILYVHKIRNSGLYSLYC